ncbi:MAG: Hsp20/alpha crystallin family protein [Clostridia bacterium]|jgi:HSP20 family protein|nr:Hsp20/alpha crystallin family protein [Clostridia bacterium]
MYGITTYKKNGYDPFKELRAWQKNFFNDENAVTIKTDIKDTGDSYVIDAELPGYKKEEINVDVKDDILTISAEKHNEVNEEEKNGYIRRERYYGSVSRSFNISEVEASQITAKHENGVLTLTLPKKKEQIPQSHKIEIN